ncbi:hypothetical protein R1flu_021357 [Riccia fluitans]|uniref:Uncharacterized protein n=1 Tax=Riccia fluitans TaxID=41844 RepID=A0ABD1ZSF0_9MARC
MPLLGIVKIALLEVEAVACHFASEHFDIWKEKKETLLNWIHSEEETLSQLSPPLPASQVNHDSENRPLLNTTEDSEVTPPSGTYNIDFLWSQRSFNVTREWDFEEGSLLACPSSSTYPEAQTPNSRDPIFQVPTYRRLHSINLPSQVARRDKEASTNNHDFTSEDFTEAINKIPPGYTELVGTAFPNLATPPFDEADRPPPRMVTLKRPPADCEANCKNTSEVVPPAARPIGITNTLDVCNHDIPRVILDSSSNRETWTTQLRQTPRSLDRPSDRSEEWWASFKPP